MDSETFDRLVEEWHHSHSELPIHEYMGISLEEYSQLVSPQSRSYIVNVSKLTSEECKTFLKSQHEKLTRKVFANIENTQGEREE